MDNIEVGQTIMLMGISRHGKNSIKQHGPLWKIERVDTNCSALFITSGKDAQWISQNGDKHFKVVGIQQDLFHLTGN